MPDVGVVVKFGKLWAALSRLPAKEATHDQHKGRVKMLGAERQHCPASLAFKLMEIWKVST